MAGLVLVLLTAMLATRTYSAAPTDTWVVIGDWGSGDAAQYKMKESIDTYLSRRNVSGPLVVSTGDQLYPFGAKSANDSIFKTNFEDVYANSTLRDSRWLMTLGNHDCLGSPKAQVEFTRISEEEHRKPRWHMPHRYYSYAAKGGKVIVLDTCSLFCMLEPNLVPGDHCYYYGLRTPEGLAEAHRQLRWLEKELKQSEPACKVVVGHVPVYSSMMYGDSQALKRLVPTMTKAGAYIYLSGHAHSMQHIQKALPKGQGPAWHQFISGGGGGYLQKREASLKRHVAVRYAQPQHGFMVMDFVGSLVNITFVDDNAKPVYSTVVHCTG